MKPKDTPEHPSRKAMWAAAQTGVVPFETHLKQCRACRELFSMLKNLRGKRRRRLEHADPDAIASYAAIPVVEESRRAAQDSSGTMRFDSWQGVPVARIRAVPTTLERRITLEADGIVLELAAERRGHEWEFVGRVYEQDVASTEYVLKAGRRTIAPDRHGYFYFRSVSPPAVVRLLSPTMTVSFERISWKAVE